MLKNWTKPRKDMNQLHWPFNHKKRPKKSFTKKQKLMPKNKKKDFLASFALKET
jgi:hypothetical protein